MGAHIHMVLFFSILLPVLAAIYTASYARWAWQRHLRGGAIFLALLALLTAVVPPLVVYRLS